jgi:hypothetical protein
MRMKQPKEDFQVVRMFSSAKYLYSASTETRTAVDAFALLFKPLFFVVDFRLLCLRISCQNRSLCSSLSIFVCCASDYRTKIFASV